MRSRRIAAQRHDEDLPRRATSSTSPPTGEMRRLGSDSRRDRPRGGQRSAATEYRVATGPPAAAATGFSAGERGVPSSAAGDFETGGSRAWFAGQRRERSGGSDSSGDSEQRHRSRGQDAAATARPAAESGRQQCPSGSLTGTRYIVQKSLLLGHCTRRRRPNARQGCLHNPLRGASRRVPFKAPIRRQRAGRTAAPRSTGTSGDARHPRRPCPGGTRLVVIAPQPGGAISASPPTEIDQFGESDEPRPPIRRSAPAPSRGGGQRAQSRALAELHAGIWRTRR